MMIITNIKVFTDNCIFVPGYIKLFGDRIKEVHLQESYDAMSYADDDIIDGQGCYCTPGLIDMHFHGCNGYDFCDGSITPGKKADLLLWNDDIKIISVIKNGQKGGQNTD